MRKMCGTVNIQEKNPTQNVLKPSTKAHEATIIESCGGHQRHGLFYFFDILNCASFPEYLHASLGRVA